MSDKQKKIFIPKPLRTRRSRDDSDSDKEPRTQPLNPFRNRFRREQTTGDIFRHNMPSNTNLMPMPSIQEFMEENRRRLNPVPIPTNQQLSIGKQGSGIFSTGLILQQLKQSKPKTMLSVSEIPNIFQHSTQYLGNLLLQKKGREERKRRKKLEPLDRDDGCLFDLLLKAFTKKPLEESDVRLSRTESEILNGLLYRKFYKRIEEADFLGDPIKLIDKIKVIVNRSAKRPEECHKFLLSKFFRHLKQEFRESPEFDENDSETFYLSIFGETAKNLGLPLKQFYFPSKSKKMGHKNTLNTEFFSRIFKSPVFISKLKNYMKKELEEDFYEDVKAKLEILFDKWIYKFQYSSEKRRLKAILKDISQNKRLKFPWIYSELEECVTRVEELILQYSDN